MSGYINLFQCVFCIPISGVENIIFKMLQNFQWFKSWKVSDIKFESGKLNGHQLFNSKSFRQFQVDLCFVETILG